MIRILVFFLAFMLFACHNDDECCVLDPESELIGNWILFERGYSPGAGYIIDPVSETPAQTITIDSNGRFSSNISELEPYRYFLILQDQDWEVLALFKKRPKNNPDLDKLERSYTIERQEDGTVRLYFRFCFEGCHLGLRKID